MRWGGQSGLPCADELSKCLQQAEPPAQRRTAACLLRTWCGGHVLQSPVGHGKLLFCKTEMK